MGSRRGRQVQERLVKHAGVLLAGSLLLACAEGEPSSPADHKPDTLKAWADQHAPADQTWRYVSLNDVSALYLDRKIGKRRYPLIAYRMKYENFEPGEADGHVFRSTEVTYEADCSRMRHRIGRVVAFARLGLTGPRFEAANPTPDWTVPGPGSDGYLLTAMACTLAQPATYDLDDPRLIRFAPDQSSAEQVAAITWVKQGRLDGNGWTMIGGGVQTAEFISDRNFDFDGYPHVRYDAKTEFYYPVTLEGRTVTSEFRRVEADCQQHRQRDLKLTFYEGSGLTGPETATAKVGDWSPPGAGLPLSETLACAFAYDLKFNRGLTNAKAASLDLF